jgi:hypothetical protein
MYVSQNLLRFNSLARARVRTANALNKFNRPEKLPG